MPNDDTIFTDEGYSPFDNRILAAGKDFYNIAKGEALPKPFMRRIRVGSPGSVHVKNGKGDTVIFENCYAGEWIDIVISEPILASSSAGNFVVDG